MKTESLSLLSASQEVRALIWPLDQYADQAAEIVKHHPLLEEHIAEVNEYIAEAALAIQRTHDLIREKIEEEFGVSLESARVTSLNAFKQGKARRSGCDW